MSSRCSSFSRSPSISLATGMPVQRGDDAGDLLLGHACRAAGRSRSCALVPRPFRLPRASSSASAGRPYCSARGLFVGRNRAGPASISALRCSISAVMRLDLFDGCSSRLSQLAFMLVEAVLAARQAPAVSFSSRSSRELVVLLLQRPFPRSRSCMMRAAQVVQLRRHGVDLRADHGAGLVDQVDGLVGQEAVGDVAVGQRRRGDERVDRGSSRRGKTS